VIVFAVQTSQLPSGRWQLGDRRRISVHHLLQSCNQPPVAHQSAACFNGFWYSI
jgi:hypothetical protein